MAPAAVAAEQATARGAMAMAVTVAVAVAVAVAMAVAVAVVGCGILFLVLGTQHGLRRYVEECKLLCFTRINSRSALLMRRLLPLLLLLGAGPPAPVLRLQGNWQSLAPPLRLDLLQPRSASPPQPHQPGAASGWTLLHGHEPCIPCNHTCTCGGVSQVGGRRHHA